MKNFCTFLFLFFSIGIVQSQTAVGGCNEVSVLTEPNYDTSLWTGTFISCPTCDDDCYRIVQYPQKIEVKHWLEKLGSSGWTVTAGPVWGYHPTFSNLSKGTYRVRFQIPKAFKNNTCPNGFDAYNTSQQDLGGKVGFHDNFPIGVSWSNTVIVGNTVINDNQFDFIDVNANNSDLAYDYGDAVVMDASASKNYNHWYLSIKETGSTYNRWRTNGWTHGTVSNIDLSFFWKDNTSWWKFETFHTYDVNFVVENYQCRNGIENPGVIWNIRTKSFFVCPAGSGCREVVDEKHFTIYPNPASNYIEFGDFDPSEDIGYNLTLHDTGGRQVRSMQLTGNSIDISDINNGMYIITLTKDNQQVFQSKLIIRH